jgi:glycosyltransferase involved in cell wall biosynthesis
MKILQVNCVYKKGSTGKIVFDLHKSYLEQGINSVVCYGRGEKIREDKVFKTCGECYSKVNNLYSRVTGIMNAGCFFSTQKLKQIILSEKPDVVHLHCINGYFVNIYRLVSFLRNQHINTVLTLHAEFMYTGGCGYALECNQWRDAGGCGISECPRWRSETGSLFRDRTSIMWKQMKNAFVGFEKLIVTSVSPWLRERAASSIILGQKRNITVLNGVNTSIFRPQPVEGLRAELGVEGKKVLLHVTAYFKKDRSHIKGGFYVMELAKKLADNPEIVILVAGPYEEIPDSPKNIVFLGSISNQEKLAALYTLANITLLTSEREAFSMVTVESMCCGTPVVGFAAGGPESIALEGGGTFVSHGDVPALAEAVHRCLATGKPDWIKVEAQKRYSIDCMASEYIKCYDTLLKN